VGTLEIYDTSGWGQSRSDWAGIDDHGQYKWDVLDRIVAVAHENGIPDLLYEISTVPSYDSANESDECGGNPQGSCDPNPDPKAFRNFVNAVVQRYCGAIKFYQGWNEPDSPNSWHAPIGLLVTYMKTAYEGVHDVSNCACRKDECAPGLAGGINPNRFLLPPISSAGLFTPIQMRGLNEISSSGTRRNLMWLKSYLDAGGQKYYDIASLHPYGPSGTCYKGPESYLEDFAAFKRVVRPQRGTRTIIWATELNWGTGSCAPTVSEQESWIARDLLLQWVIGTERLQWYTFDTCTRNCDAAYGIIEPASRQLSVFQHLQSWMLGTVERDCRKLPSHNWICDFTRPSIPEYEALFVWNDLGTGSFTVPPGITQYEDLLGNVTATKEGQLVQLTTAPLLFEQKRRIRGQGRP
jgi:hypothetical protein